MAVYEIEGEQFEIPDEVQGAQLEETLTLLSSSQPKNLPEFGTIDANQALFGSQFGDENTGTGKLIRDAAAQLFTLSGKARLDGFQKRFPELNIEPIADDNAVITNPTTGGRAILNAKGLSTQDIAPFIGAALAATPVIRGAQTLTGGAKLGLAGRSGVAAGEGLATDLALQGAEQIQGSDQGFDATRAATSAVAPGALPSVSTAVSSGAQRIAASNLAKKAAPSIQTLRESAGAIYKQIDDLGGRLDKRFSNSMLMRLNARLGKEVLPESQPTAVRQILQSFKNRKDKELSFTEFDAIRKTAGTLSRSADPNERRLGGIVTEELDDAFEAMANRFTGGKFDVGAKFKQARALWRRSRKAEILEEAVRKAENQATGLENGLRAQFRAISNNQKLKRNFTEEELRIIDGVHKGDFKTNLAKFVGKFGALEGQNPRALLPLIGIGAGAQVAGPAGAVAVPAIGQVSRGLAQKLTANKAKLASQIVRSGRDGRKVALTYIRSVPRKQRSADELAELLLMPDLDVSKMKDLAKASKGPTQNLLIEAMAIAGASDVGASDLLTF